MSNGLQTGFLNLSGLTQIDATDIKCEKLDSVVIYQDGLPLDFIINNDNDLNFVGVYSDIAPYYKNNVVFYQGSSYVCLVEYSLGNTPTDTNFFAMLCQKGDQGVQGIQGPQGNTGAQGARGNTGFTGPAGPQGNAGPQGPQGNVGPQGPQGNAGPQGPQGPQGSQGPQGNVGPVGPQGNVGSVGPKGDTGSTGATGPRGFTGAQSNVAGPKGDTGTSFIWKGEYQGVTGQYKANDCVYFEGSSYISLIDNIMANIRDSNIFNKMTQGLNWRQYYYDNTNYYPFDVLLYYGSCYICIKQAYNKEPTNTEYWNLMVSKGDKGDRGDNAGENSGGGGGGGSFDFGGVADIANGVATATSTAVLAAAIMFLRGEVALLWANVTALNAKTINQAAILGSTTFTGITNFSGDVKVNNGIFNYATITAADQKITTTNLQVVNTAEAGQMNVNNSLLVTNDITTNRDLFTNNIKPLPSNAAQNINISGFIKNNN